MGLSASDGVYMERACELARRGAGGTSPNPCVGAVIVRDDRVVGEGYHHRAGEPHAEVQALQQAGERARGATMYVTLEPCNHTGRTPPCAPAIVQSGIARTVVGVADPNPITAGAGIRFLRDHGAHVDVADDPQAQEIAAPFARAIHAKRPFVTLKMAMSLDGYVASAPGKQQWLTGDETRAFVRDLRIEHDAVGVGAGTVRVDDPQLTVRPMHVRELPYVRVVFCERDAVSPQSRIFAENEGYAQTVVLAPAGARERFATLERVADVAYIGEGADLHILSALQTLRERGITSLLCEGGPTFAATLLRLRCVDRVVWIVAPVFLHAPHAVKVLAGDAIGQITPLRVVREERLGRDVAITADFDDV